MAGAITVVASIGCRNRDFTFPVNGAIAKQVVQRGYGGGYPGLFTVGHGPVQLDLSPIEIPGWCRIQNLDAVQSVRWSFTSGTLTQGGLLLPGEPAIFRLNTTSGLWFQVDPATEEGGSTSAENQAKLQITIFED